MQRNQLNPVAISLISLVVTILFVLVLVLADYFFAKADITIKDVVISHLERTSYWFIYISPVVVGLIAYKLATVILKSFNTIEKLRVEQFRKNENIHKYVKEIEEDQSSGTYQLDFQNDILAKSLFELKDKLRNSKIEEIERRKENEERSWFSSGLAHLNEILTKNQDNLQELSYNFISELVKYTDSNQGGVYILNDDIEYNKYFELTACYAYDKRKFTDSTIEFGVGLIGACAMEKEPIFLTEIPDSYLKITSGLGHANPRCILLVPLNTNDANQGVIEIASFKEYNAIQKEFIEKVSESFASTIAGLKANLRTVKHLEESREIAERLSAQEEELRQNLEELQATQEEAARQSEKFISFSDSVNQTLIRADYDTKGYLLFANNKFVSKLGYISLEEITGLHISSFLNEKDRTWFENIWKNVSAGIEHFEGYMKHLTKSGQDLWTMSNYTCVKDSKGNIEKVLFLAIDTTDQKKLSLDYEEQLSALDLSMLKAEFGLDGSLIKANNLFQNFINGSAELLNTTIFDLIAKDEREIFLSTWEKISSGKHFEGQIKIQISDLQEKWLRGTFTAVRDMYGEIARIILIANEITHEKLMEFEAIRQTELLKEQEIKLKNSDQELRARLKEATDEMRMQFKETEKLKLRNERTLEGALDAIITVDKNGRIEFFNKAAEELWSYKKDEVIGKDVSVLFSASQIQENEFIKTFVDPKKSKIIGKRQEVGISDKDGIEKQVLFLLSEAIVDKEHTYTAFIQNIEVELF